jgi:hypothetical protein
MLYLGGLVATIAVGGCGSRQVKPDESFSTATPFSHRIPVSGEAACWAVKRAFLSQGYMIDAGSGSLILLGTKDTQADDETSVTQRLQTTCADNRDGSSTIFVTATRETNKLQKVKQSVTAGVSIATVTVPTGSERVMRTIRRETIQDPGFYQRFYKLVQTYAVEEERSLQAERPVRRQ